MDQDTLVDTWVEDGWALIGDLAREGFDVTAACWVKSASNGRWTLYIASREYDDRGPAVAYKKLVTSLRRLDNPWAHMFPVQLISAKSPVVEDVRKLRKLFSGMAPPRGFSNWLGDLAVDDIYLYPPPQNGTPAAEARRLKRDVKPVARPDDLTLTEADHVAVNRLVVQGVGRPEAEEWVRKRREKIRPRPVIPAGTLVKAWPAAYWGDKPEDDPNPVLLVETADGTRGLAFQTDTEPVG